MTGRGKTPEEWVVFLLTLIDHTKDFKPDWEQFAMDTGMYKRGKFVRQAYDGLRKKYATGQLFPNMKHDGNGNGNTTIPQTPRSRVTQAEKPTSGMKRKQNHMEDREDDLDGGKKSSVNKKRKAARSIIVLDNDGASTDEKDGGRKNKFGNESDGTEAGEAANFKGNDIIKSIERQDLKELFQCDE